MPFQSVPGVAQTIIRAELDEQECLTILNWRAELSPHGSINLLNLVTNVQVVWANEALPLLPPTYIASQVEATVLESEVDETATATFSDGDGTNTSSPPLPNSVSLAIQHKTGMSGKWARGRSFWPCLMEAGVINNEVTLLTVAAYLNVFETMRTELLGVSWHHCVVSRWYNKVKRPEGVTFDVTNYAVGDFVVDSMRRRLPKRGR